jgi:hypothetical protein
MLQIKHDTESFVNPIQDGVDYLQTDVDHYRKRRFLNFSEGIKSLNYSLEPKQSGFESIELLLRLHLCPGYDVADLVTQSVTIHFCAQGKFLSLLE